MNAADLVPLVQLQLKNVPEAAAQYALRAALSDVCQEADCWKIDQTLTATGLSEEKETGVDQPVDLDTIRYDAKPFKIVRVYVTPHDDDGEYTQARRLVDPWFYRLDHDGQRFQIIFEPMYAIYTDNRVEVRLSLQPSRTGDILTSMPAPVVDLLQDSVIPKAAERLARQQGRPWTNKPDADILHQEYLHALRILLNQLGSGSTTREERRFVEDIPGG